MSEPLELQRDTAARWVERIDAGLAADEELAFEAWIEADPRHAELLAEARAVWDRFGALAETVAPPVPDADHFAPAPARLSWRRSLALPLAAAALLAFGLSVWLTRPRGAETAVVLPSPLTQRTLADGSTVELNRGAEIATAFTPAERRVVLLKGEANFHVAHNAAVPFIVAAGGVEVRAVGTAFNVRFDPHAVEVVVTEGKVQVATPADLSTAPKQYSVPLLEAGQRTYVSLAPAPVVPQVATLSKVELETKLAWQPKLLDFDDSTLGDIVREFNQRNPVHLVIRDPAIASLRLNASFRSDNMEGFVRLLEANFGLRTEAISETEIGLRRAR